MPDEAAYWFLLACAGLAAGSLLNVVILRLPLMVRGEAPPGFNLWLPASHCPQCKHRLRWQDNIPLFSWLCLHGRCFHCRQRIPWRYPLTEGVTLLLTLLAGVLFPAGPLLLAVLLFSWIVLALGVIDAQHQLLPDALTLLLLWLGLLVTLAGWKPGVDLHDSVAGAIAGYLVLALLAYGYRLCRGKEALGMGDAKLLAACGAWLGWQPLPHVLLIASLSGIFWALLTRVFYRRPLQKPLPFGPFLAAAAWLLLISASLQTS